MARDRLHNQKEFLTLNGLNSRNRSSPAEKEYNRRRVFKAQGPARAVERVHFSQTPDFHAGRRRNEQNVDEGGGEQRDDSHLRYVPYGAALEIEDERADERPYRHHGLQAYKAAFDEFPGRLRNRRPGSRG